MEDINNQKLTIRILIGLVIGAIVGCILFWLRQSPGLQGGGVPEFINTWLVGGLFEVGGSIFVASLRVMVVPLVFVSLVCGTSSIQDQSKVGVLAIKTMVLYCLTTAAAISLALFIAILSEPGSGIVVEGVADFEPRESPGLVSVLINIFPSNFIRAMSEGNMLQVIVFAIFFGVALSRVGEAGQRVTRFFTELDTVIMRMVVLLMQFAPFGVFCLIARMFAGSGLENIAGLASYFITVLVALILHGLGFFTLFLIFVGGLNPMHFFRKVRQIWLFGFSTASSSATLPVTLSVVEKRLGVDNKVASFTIPLGATINMDGTAIMQGVATVFIAQAYGVDIGLSGYLTVIATATLASIGTAGVPGVGLITLALVLEQVGLPVEGIAMIIGVDRLLDMVRTAVNLTGDAAVSCVVARSSRELDLDVFRARD